MSHVNVKLLVPNDGRFLHCAKLFAGGKIKAKAKAATARTALTAPQLVRYFAHAIQTEIPDLLFDYFAMHKMARGLLEKVRTHADDIGLPLVSHVADVAGLVLAIGAGELGFKPKQSQEVLDKVAMVIQEYISEELDCR